MKRGESALEALLRPPVEWYSTVVLWTVAIIALAAPWALMLPWLAGIAVAMLAGYVGWIRLRDGLYVVKYHHYLKYYAVTRIAPHKIPVDKATEYYLGEGFEWTQQHTQRLHEARRPEAQPYVNPGKWQKAMQHWAARISADESAGAMLKAITGFDCWFNPMQVHPDLGGSPLLHGVGALEEAPVKMRQSSRTGHMVVMGTTRVGKTRMLEMFATQDIHAGHIVIVIDPKGDADLMLRIHAEARRAGRLEQFYLFHLGYPEISARYNGIGSFSRITEVAARATNALPVGGNSAAFKEFSWRFTNIVAQAQVALGQIPTYEALLRDVTGIEPLFMQYAHWYFRNKPLSSGASYEDRLASLEADVESRDVKVEKSIATRTPDVVAMILLIREVRPADNVLNGLVGAVSYDRSFYEKIIASLGPFLEKLISGAVGKLISPDYFDADDTRPIFDWMTVMRQGGIVYAGLDALSDSVVSSAVGNSMLADLVSVGGKLYKTGLDPHNADGRIILPTVCCHFDEVNEIAGPEFVPMVNKLGGSGFRVTAYTQSLFDIEAKVGDRAKAGQIMDNFNHLVMMRVRSVATANLVAEQMPQVDVVHLTPMSGVTDTAAQGTGVDFTSRNDDIITSTKMTMLQAADILKLPQGQAVALLEGNRCYKIRIPLADTANDEFIPESLKAVATQMRQRYRTSERWADETDWLGKQPIGEGLINTGLVPSMDETADDEGAPPAGGSSGADTGLSQPVIANVLGHRGM